MKTSKEICCEIQQMIEHHHREGMDLDWTTVFSTSQGEQAEFSGGGFTPETTRGEVISSVTECVTDSDISDPGGLEAAREYFIDYWTEAVLDAENQAALIKSAYDWLADGCAVEAAERIHEAASIERAWGDAPTYGALSDKVAELLAANTPSADDLDRNYARAAR